jgi:hypothetical protein
MFSCVALTHFVGVVECVLVPCLQYVALSDLSSGQMFDMNSGYTPPDNAEFNDGLAVNVNASSHVCGGVDPTSRVISLCQALDLNAGLGNLLAFVFELPLVDALTMPAILTSFGLPFRLYLLALVPSSAGVVLVCVLSLLAGDQTQDGANHLIAAYAPTAHTSSHPAAFFPAFALVVYVGRFAPSASISIPTVACASFVPGIMLALSGGT